ncbi:WD40 repeat-like protein [Melanogaster broomeanus]|nr:WD40 repeat-like protein [Melanogaster broomeanus]
MSRRMMGKTKRAIGKISVLQHAPSTHLPARPGDPTPTSRNLDPLMHPFARARERMRALNAAKMDRMFAKPFIASLEGHIDAIEVLCKKPGTVNTIASGSWDGGVIVHNIAEQKQSHQIQGAHKGKVSGLCFADGNRLLSCGVDSEVRLWDVSPQEQGSASNIVQIWDETKSAAVSNLTFPTATETVTSVRFNLAETSAERRVIMQMRSNALSWSPVFPTSVLLASEDHNLYTFDAHVAAVMSCDWSPTGLEFVSGGWDRTVRCMEGGAWHEPGISSSIFTADARFVISGSDDGNVRIWKAKASEKLGIITARERAAIEYRDSLKERWKHDQDVGKISRTRYLPKPVYQAAKLKRTMLEAQRVKQERRRKHTRAGESKPKAERKKIVLTEQT